MPLITEKNDLQLHQIQTNSNIVTDHVPPHLKVGYDKANDYPPGTHIVIAWLKEESCDFYTWYLGEFIKIDVLDLCVIVSFNLQCVICSANLLITLEFKRFQSHW